MIPQWFLISLRVPIVTKVTKRELSKGLQLWRATGMVILAPDPRLLRHAAPKMAPVRKVSLRVWSFRPSRGVLLLAGASRERRQDRPRRSGMVILAPDPPPRQVQAANRLAQGVSVALGPLGPSAPALLSLFDDVLEETMVTRARVRAASRARIQNPHSTLCQELPRIVAILRKMRMLVV